MQTNMKLYYIIVGKVVKSSLWLQEQDNISLH